MTNTERSYGTTVAEIHPFDESAYQAILDKNTKHYNARSEGLHHKGMAANIDFITYKPLEMSLIEVQHVIRRGYSIVKAEAGTLWFKAILRKPEYIITQELDKLAKETFEKYESARYELNVSETARLIEENIFNARRAAEAVEAAKLAKIVAKKEANEEHQALADVLAAYAQPTQTAEEVGA